MDRWHGKHPIPWDMFNSFSNIAGKDLSWFWNNWFFTNSYMDIAVTDVKPNASGYALSIKNIGGYAVPTDIMVEYTDGSKENPASEGKHMGEEYTNSLGKYCY